MNVVQICSLQFFSLVLFYTCDIDTFQQLIFSRYISTCHLKHNLENNQVKISLNNFVSCSFCATPKVCDSETVFIQTYSFISPPPSLSLSSLSSLTLSFLSFLPLSLFLSLSHCTHFFSKRAFCMTHSSSFLTLSFP